MYRLASIQKPRTCFTRGASSWFPTSGSMNMAAASDAQNINIELTVASPRSVDLLFSQLNNWWTSHTLPSARAQPHHNKSAPERKRNIKMTTKKADYIWFNGEMVPLGRREGACDVARACTMAPRFLKASVAYDSHKGPVVFRPS